MKIATKYLITLGIVLAQLSQGCNGPVETNDNRDNTADAGSPDGDADGENDADTDTDTEADTDSNTDGDTNNDPDAVELPEDFSHFFECPERVDDPSDVAVYSLIDANTEKIVDLFGRIRETAYKWIDEECLSDCALTENQTACIEGSCTTEDGATIIYDYSEHEGGFEYPERDSETMAVIPPTGKETWEEIRFSRSFESPIMEGGLFGTDWTAEWKGDIDPSWPSDASLSGEKGSFFEGDSWTMWSFSYKDCEIWARSFITDGDETFTIKLNGTEVWVGCTDMNISTYECTFWRADINGECVGEVHPNNWNIIGPCEE